MSTSTLAESVHLTPAERYFRGEIDLEKATSEEVAKMHSERRETPFGLLNVVIRVFVLVIAIPVIIVNLLNPRRWFA